MHRLQEILEKNASGGLSRTELGEAVQLIKDPVYSEKNCWLCKMHDRYSRSIYDIGLCQGHAYSVLGSGK